jgi:hypothetical protein
MPEKPNPRELRMVILFDPQDESFCVFSHNLSTEDASQELEELGNEGLFAIAVDQSSHHAADYADDCTLCRAVLATTCPRDVCHPPTLNNRSQKLEVLMTSEGNGFTHYLVSKEVVLGEARVIEKYNEWISLAFIKLGIDRQEAVIDRAFVENHALVPKIAN